MLFTIVRFQILVILVILTISMDHEIPNNSVILALHDSKDSYDANDFI